MVKNTRNVDTTRASRAGHTFHERWAARRALQLVFPKDNLFAIIVEGLSSQETLELGKEAEDIADLVLYYGVGQTFETCSAQQILQFKYKVASAPVTASYLKKTVEKFAATLRNFEEKIEEELFDKLTFGFVTNAEFSPELWDAISCLQTGGAPKSKSAKAQARFLEKLCKSQQVQTDKLFPIIEFRAGTSDLPAQDRQLRRTISDWSADSDGRAKMRLYALVELVREKAQIEGQHNNAIRREDVLNALECDEDQLFPADTRFIDVGEVVERKALKEVAATVLASDLPVFLHADGGVGKTVFIQSFANHLADRYEVVIFDCFGGGAYRSEAQGRHRPGVGLLQIINELASRGLCDPLLPTDSDQQGIIHFARKRLKQASETVRNQSTLNGVLVILDAADNAQLEADARNELAFPRLLLASLCDDPIEGVKLLLTARPHRMDDVVGKNSVVRMPLKPFSERETRQFLKARRDEINDVEFSTAFARSQGNARVLEYLAESWDANILGNTTKKEVTVEELIEQKCEKIFRRLHELGWEDAEVCEFFAAVSLLPPPIPLMELANALNWSESQVNSAASDLTPMLELVSHGAIFRDEPTETYIKEHYANEEEAQQSIAQRLQDGQTLSMYAAEALPHFLVVIGDSDRAYLLAGSDTYPAEIKTEHGRRRLKLVRLYAAFSLAVRENDLDRVLTLTMQLAEVASANARGDQFIRRSPALAMVLGDSDASRRLFNDRTGWRGARDTRLTVAHAFVGDIDEARIHQNRAIGWTNWYLHNEDERKRSQRSGFDAFDVAALLFVSVLEDEFGSFNRNMKIWNFRFAVSVSKELAALCRQHELATGSNALNQLLSFAKSKHCSSLAVQVGLLINDCGLTKSQLKAVSRATSVLIERQKIKISDDNHDHEMELQWALGAAATTSIVANSRQSAKRLVEIRKSRRPTSYDFGERHGMNRIWTPVLSACLAAWSSGEKLSYKHLIPENVPTGRRTNTIKSEEELRDFLDALVVIDPPNRNRKKNQAKTRKQFSKQEVQDIVEGTSCILQLVKPVENAILSKTIITNKTLADFLSVWRPALRPDVHWRSETGRDNVARYVGVGLATLLLRHADSVDKKEADEILEIVSGNRFDLDDKLGVLGLIAERENLAEVAGQYARSVSEDIVKDDYIEQRGESFRTISHSLLAMSISEAKDYYRQGLSQLDQMGSDDFDLIYSALHFAAEQPGGFVKPELSHRLMGLCQTIFQHEPSKFGWTLFGRAAASSIGFPSIYKLLRWHDQDAVDYSYGLPQLACFLAKAGHLDPRRAAVLLTVCENHGWHEWRISTGLKDLLSVADIKDRKAIFSLICEKLEREHSFGGWDSLWDGLQDCVKDFPEVAESAHNDHLERLRNSARKQRDLENARQKDIEQDRDRSLSLAERKQRRETEEVEFSSILEEFDFACASPIDDALQRLKSSNLAEYEYRSRLVDELRCRCPYNRRLGYIEAICESAELEFDRALDLMIECVEAWAESTAHVRSAVFDLIKKLFSFKGSELFELRYSGISRQIHRLSKLCGDQKFVLQLALETIAKEQLELGADEWLQVATSLTSATTPSSAFDALESLLAGSSATVGDEIGEGKYRSDFKGETSQGDVFVDVIWHLLGNSDAFVRWHAARALKGILDVGLAEDIGSLLGKFDSERNAALESDDHHFAFMNAQTWLLIGLARAALHHQKSLQPLKPELEKLAHRSDLHALNKLYLARILTHLEGGTAQSPELIKLCNEIVTPQHGVVERDGRSVNKARNSDFRFDYEFDKYEVPELARIFGISNNEASDFIASEVTKRWPDAKDMSDLPGGVRYRRGSDDRFETYREHVQKHARLNAVTTLAQSRPVVRSSYDWKGRNPLHELLGEFDVSFKDGSWLADHKDRVPAPAHEYLLAKRQGNQEHLIDAEALFKAVGFPMAPDALGCTPLYGSWKSKDGVYVRLVPALIGHKGAVGRCAKFAKAESHELWLPMLGANGRSDRFHEKRPFYPMIWEPEKYPIGIDEGDEWATRGAAARPRLGLALTKVLSLVPDSDLRNWFDAYGNTALWSDVWGEWVNDPDEHRNRVREEGSLLWAKTAWLDRALTVSKRALVYQIDLSKYKSTKSYDDASGVRAVYVGLKRGGELPRFWHAKKASKTVY